MVITVLRCAVCALQEMLVRSMRALNDSEADVGSGPKHDVSLQGPDGRRAADRALLAQATRVSNHTLSILATYTTANMHYSVLATFRMPAVVHARVA